VVRRDEEGRDLDWVEPLGLAEDTEHDVVESWVGPEKITALDGAAGDVDECAFFWDVA
jgi:hypothetical protein